MQALLTKVEETRLRLRDVWFLLYFVQHMAWLSLLLAVVAGLDKSGLLVISDWPEAGVWRDGGFALPGANLPELYRVAIPSIFGVSVFLALFRVMRRPCTRQHAALALDQALNLKERITSALAFSSSNLPMSAPLAEDAAAYTGNIQVKKVFRHSGGGRKLPWALLALLFSLALLPELDIRGVRAEEQEKRNKQEEAREEVLRKADTLRKMAELLKKREHAKVTKKDLRELTKKMEDLAEKLEKDKTIDPKLATQMMNRLQEKMQEQAKKDMSEAKGAKLDSSRMKRTLMRDMVDKMKKNQMKDAADLMKRMRRQLATKEMKPEELDRLSKDMKDLSEQLKEQGLEELSKDFQKMSDELKDIQDSKALDKMKKLQDALDKAFKNMKDKQLDLSSLTEEEKALLKKLQSMMAQMEMTEKMMEQMQQSAEQGNARMITAEELKKMLEQLKNGICPLCGGKVDKDGKSLGDGQEGQDGKDGKGGKDGDGGEGRCPVCGGKTDKNGNCKNGQSGGLMGIPGMGGMSSGNAGNGSGGQTGGSGQASGGNPGERKNDVEFESAKLRARRIMKGKIVSQMFVRGLPPGEHKPTVEYSGQIEEAVESQDSVRERETIPLEEREFLRNYNNVIKGTGQD